MKTIHRRRKGLTRPGRKHALQFIARVAHRYTIKELAAMDWPNVSGGTARFHYKTITNWLRAEGIEAKPHVRPDQLSDESKREILRRYRAGETVKELAAIRWTMKGGHLRTVNRTTIYDACIRRNMGPGPTFQAKPMTDAAWNRWMLFGDSGL